MGRVGSLPQCNEAPAAPCAPTRGPDQRVINEGNNNPGSRDNALFASAPNPDQEEAVLDLGRKLNQRWSCPTGRGRVGGSKKVPPWLDV